MTVVDNPSYIKELPESDVGQKIPNNDQNGPSSGPESGPEKGLSELIHIWFSLSDKLRESLLLIAREADRVSKSGMK